MEIPFDHSSGKSKHKERIVDILFASFSPLILCAFARKIN
jgi:hypothetical protein